MNDSGPVGEETPDDAPSGDGWRGREEPAAQRRGLVRGGAAGLLAQVGRHLLGAASTVVLARILAPSDFGLLAVILVARAVLVPLKDFGLGLSTVQRTDLSEDDAARLFWVNGGVGLVLAAVLAAAGPLLAVLLGEPRLAGLSALVATSFALVGFGVQHRALMRRRLQLGRLAVIDFVEVGAGVAAGITLGLLGAGAWSLAAIPVAESLVGTLLAWRLLPWRPRWSVRLAGLSGLVSFGADVTLARVLAALGEGADRLFVAAAAGPTVAGLYAKASQLAILPERLVGSTVGLGGLPVLSRLQDDPDAFRARYLQGALLASFLGLPVVTLAFAVAEPLIVTLLGPAWREAAAMYRWLAPLAAARLLDALLDWACLPLGRSGRLVRCRIAEAIVQPLAALLALPHGAVAVAAAVGGTALALRCVLLPWALRGTPVRGAAVAGVLWRPALAALVAGAAAGAAATLLGRGSLPTPVVTAVVVALHGTLYLGTWALLPGGRATLARLGRLVHDLRT